jgi:oxygen-independent coproporphyrinogen-3 oxidase
MPIRRSLYLHIPFCSKRCNYCDFVTYSGMQDWIPAYMEALKQEVRVISDLDAGESEIHTIFLGGGTPSLLPADELQKLFTTISDALHVRADAEISMEINPGTLTLEKMLAYQQAGVNRVSLGVQSFSDEELRLLGRIHTAQVAREAVEIVRQAGIQNLNLDMIYGLPGQNLADWEYSLRAVQEIKPEHISLYCLTIEEGTPLAEVVKRGDLTPIDDDLAASMYELAIDELSSMYEHYEISNWARLDASPARYRCIHNLQYWTNDEYFGLGAGAHGYYRGIRTINPDTIQSYIEWINSAPDHLENGSAVETAEKTRDEMMLGLRLLLNGVRDQEFMNKFGLDFRQIFNAKIARLIQLGLVTWSDADRSALILTRRGMMLGNQVFMQFSGPD